MDLTDTPVTVYYDRQRRELAGVVRVLVLSGRHGDGDGQGHRHRQGAAEVGHPERRAQQRADREAERHARSRTPANYAWPLGEAFTDPDVAGGTRTDHAEVAGLTRDELVKLIRAIDMGGQFYARQNSDFKPFTDGDPVAGRQVLRRMRGNKTMTRKFRRFLTASIALSAAALASLSSAADDAGHDASRALQRVREPEQQLARGGQHVGAPARFTQLRRSRSAQRVANRDQFAPTQYWTMLEHGERVECLDCIPYVSKMLYASNPKTREISAWWLRRRIFGVFGKGEVYEQTINTVSNPQASELSRTYAANALGEFLEGAGIAPVSKALGRRQLARGSLGRRQRADSAEQSRPELGAFERALRRGRRSAAGGLERRDAHQRVQQRRPRGRLDQRSFGAGAPARGANARHAEDADAVVGLIALTSAGSESDAGVRAAAVWALGQIADPQARDAVLAAAERQRLGRA